ncbi:carbohydrate ABC transporter permease [Poriferisphaera sp. WC338]|uniref:carbohydrate ABC transporter permease n=1 Tax=Poriferisphaera sp. WC338 TaxID=3425129 RepID=UPI003D817F42
MLLSKKSRRELLAGIAFLSPNITGVIIFVVFPVLFSIYMSVTNWDLTQHNPYKDEPLSFVGLDNFIRLFNEPNFWKFFGNTLYLMMGIPFFIGASLCAALLLSQNPRSDSPRVYRWLIVSAIFGISIAIIFAAGYVGTGMIILLTGLVGMILIGGITGGNTIYRTLFYLPSFTTGVPTFILWKHMYNPRTGPINVTLTPVLDHVSATVESLPPSLVQSGLFIALCLIALLLYFAINKLRAMLSDGDLGSIAIIPAIVILMIPIVVALMWGQTSTYAWALAGVVLIILAAQFILYFKSEKLFSCSAMEGFGNALLMSLGVMVACLATLGLGAVFYNLPAMVSDPQSPGLEPPKWLYAYEWAKPSMIMISFWAAVGSNNMLLYIAALTNVPKQLYEAADIDGATKFARFWNVTWPQLAPTTFFIAVMAVIYGLQGGFEMARTLNKGGPAGSTTPLSYFIYTEGFETGRLGYSSAIAWVLFLFIFIMTMFNWTFGNRYVND